jgi:hypothetical protein
MQKTLYCTGHLS